MTINELYNALHSRLFYERNSLKRYKFQGNSLFIDRKAWVPFNIYLENNCIYLSALLSENEEHFRVVMDDTAAIYFYEKLTGKETLILE